MAGVRTRRDESLRKATTNLSEVHRHRAAEAHVEDERCRQQQAQQDGRGPSVRGLQGARDLRVGLRATCGCRVLDAGEIPGDEVHRADGSSVHTLTMSRLEPGWGEELAEMSPFAKLQRTC